MSYEKYLNRSKRTAELEKLFLLIQKMIDADTDTKAQGLMDLVVDQVEKIKKLPPNFMDA